jgi:hypothetical protein
MSDGEQLQYRRRLISIATDQDLFIKSGGAGPVWLSVQQSYSEKQW